MNEIATVTSVIDPNSRDYDAIVIGSGIGGLTTASVLAQDYGERVLVIERHGKLGGFTHSFGRLKKYQFDVGIHYVGQMQPTSPMRRLFDRVTQRQVEWLALPEPMQYYCYPGTRVSISNDPHKTIQELTRHFPDSESDIKNYFRSIQSLSKKVYLYFASRQMPRLMQSLVWRLLKPDLFQSTEQWMAEQIQNPKLRAVLDSQWGDYGLPSHLSSAMIHSLIVSHYRNGAYYPSPGSQAISQSVKSIVETNGGACLTRNEAVEILSDNNRCKGVRVKNLISGEIIDYRAPVVYSNAGAWNTYSRLLGDRLGDDGAKPGPNPAELNIARCRQQLAQLGQGYHVVTLYLGLKDHPRSIGIHGENYWIYRHWDHRQNWEDRRRLGEGVVSSAFVSFASAHTQTLKPGQCHTAQVIVPCDFETFAKWKDAAKGQRGDDYLALKNKITQAIWEFLGRDLPQLREFVEFEELGTPLSYQHYSAHPQGQIYGVPQSPERLRCADIGARTPLENLFLTGADAGTLGVVGAMAGALNALQASKGWSVMRKVFR